MAFMNQEKKAAIAVEVKKVMPKGWKYTLGVKHHSTIVLTISSAPIDLVALSKYDEQNKRDGYLSLNEYHLEHAFSGELLDTFAALKAALNLNNHDRSDISTDYFDVGHYVSMRVGRWDKPFVMAAA